MAKAESGLLADSVSRAHTQKLVLTSSAIPRYNRITRHLVDIGVPAEKEVIQWGTVYVDVVRGGACGVTERLFSFVPQ